MKQYPSPLRIREQKKYIAEQRKFIAQHSSMLARQKKLSPTSFLDQNLPTIRKTPAPPEREIQNLKINNSYIAEKRGRSIPKSIILDNEKLPSDFSKLHDQSLLHISKLPWDNLYDFRKKRKNTRLVPILPKHDVKDIYTNIRLKRGLKDQSISKIRNIVQNTESSSLTNISKEKYLREIAPEELIRNGYRIFQYNGAEDEELIYFKLPEKNFSNKYSDNYFVPRTGMNQLKRNPTLHETFCKDQQFDHQEQKEKYTKILKEFDKLNEDREQIKKEVNDRNYQFDRKKLISKIESKNRSKTSDIFSRLSSDNEEDLNKEKKKEKDKKKKYKESSCSEESSDEEIKTKHRKKKKDKSDSSSEQRSNEKSKEQKNKNKNKKNKEHSESESSDSEKSKKSQMKKKKKKKLTSDTDQSSDGKSKKSKKHGKKRKQSENESRSSSKSSDENDKMGKDKKSKEDNSKRNKRNKSNDYHKNMKRELKDDEVSDKGKKNGKDDKNQSEILKSKTQNEIKNGLKVAISVEKENSINAINRNNTTIQNSELNLQSQSDENLHTENHQTTPNLENNQREYVTPQIDMSKENMIQITKNREENIQESNYNYAEDMNQKNVFSVVEENVFEENINTEKVKEQFHNNKESKQEKKENSGKEKEKNKDKKERNKEKNDQSESSEKQKKKKKKDPKQDKEEKNCLSDCSEKESKKKKNKEKKQKDKEKDDQSESSEQEKRKKKKDKRKNKEERDSQSESSNNESKTKKDKKKKEKKEDESLNCSSDEEKDKKNKKKKHKQKQKQKLKEKETSSSEEYKEKKLKKYKDKTLEEEKVNKSKGKKEDKNAGNTELFVFSIKNEEERINFKDYCVLAKQSYKLGDYKACLIFRSLNIIFAPLERGNPTIYGLALSPGLLEITCMRSYREMVSAIIKAISFENNQFYCVLEKKLLKRFSAEALEFPDKQENIDIILDNKEYTGTIEFPALELLIPEIQFKHKLNLKINEVENIIKEGFKNLGTSVNSYYGDILRP